MNELVSTPAAAAVSTYVLEIWAIILVILATIILMSFLMFGPTLSVIVYRIWRCPPQNSVV